MQMVINIDKDVYTALHGKNTKVISMLDILNAIRNGTVLPENPTNGDMIKHLLYGKAVITEFIHDVNISVNNNVIGQFDREWWNAPYKRGDTE